MTKQEFDLKYRGEKVAVHCDTEEKAKAFLKLAKSFGYKWSDGTDLESKYSWKNYGDDLCFAIDDFGLGFVMGGVEIHKYEGYKIDPFELDEPKETFNVGDVVYDTIIGTNAKVIDIKPYYLLQDYGYYVDETRINKVKPLKEITEKELAEMGYVLKK